MNELEKMMAFRERQLGSWLRELERRLKNPPLGSLRVRQWGKRIQYSVYQGEIEAEDCEGMSKKRVQKERYLGKGQLPLIRQLGQRDYDRASMKLIQKELQAIQTFKETASLCVEELFDTLSEGRKQIIQPLALTDRQYLEEWIKRKKQGHKPFPEGGQIYLTAKKERVRSKSEVLIADALARYGIPYLYECPLSFGGKTIFPDFTLPDPILRQDVYFEHLGMMDNGFYGGDAVDKLGLYRKNGIVPGKRLILSFESYRNPLNITQIEELIRQYLPWYLAGERH